MEYEFKGEQLDLVEEATELLKQRTIKKRLDLLGRIRLNLKRQNKLVKMVDEQASSMMNHSAEAVWSLILITRRPRRAKKKVDRKTSSSWYHKDCSKIVS